MEEHPPSLIGNFDLKQIIVDLRDQTPDLNHSLQLNHLASGFLPQMKIIRVLAFLVSGVLQGNCGLEFLSLPPTLGLDNVDITCINSERLFRLLLSV